ncbi:MAG: FAD-dependent oxidoreductase, partial [Rhodospirillaceae bacterium]|nr:FAD-dependent oxidoreductase [Rhodospirillaceae bacterium]
MADILKVDICVVGAGSGGLSVAAGASQMGASVVLIEKHLMGGDCLNTGCVPSKALLAAGHAAEAVRHAPGFGASSSEPVIDAAAV